jgi:hypothetical protein
MDAAKPVQARIEGIKAKLDLKLRIYREVEEAKARDLERKRQAELARLETIRLQEENLRRQKEAEDRKAAEALAQGEELDIPEEPAAPPPPSKVEQQIASLQAKLAVVPVKPSGIKYVVALKHEVTNAAILPKEFQIISADDRKIRAMYCVGYKEGQPLPQVPGVRFVVEKNIAGTGR